MTLSLQGREIGADDLGWIGQLLQKHPDWSRWKLSKVLCEEWNWRNAAGQLKDMAARTLLLKLQARGHLQLPARRQTPAHHLEGQAGGVYDCHRIEASQENEVTKGLGDAPAPTEIAPLIS